MSKLILLFILMILGCYPSTSEEAKQVVLETFPNAEVSCLTPGCFGNTTCYIADNDKTFFAFIHQHSITIYTKNK